MAPPHNARRRSRGTPNKGDVIVMKNKAAYALRTIAKNAIHAIAVPAFE
jgi:hypothetical protein